MGYGWWSCPHNNLELAVMVTLLLCWIAFRLGYVVSELLPRAEKP